MKKLFSTIVGLFLVGITMAQVPPGDLWISGTVVDINGIEVAGAEVCAYSDSTGGFMYYGCATTNQFGNYFLEIVGGSTAGPNVDFTVFLNEVCTPLFPGIPPQTVSNMQGTVDVVNDIDFVSCANGNGGGGNDCGVTITSSVSMLDSTMFDFTANATGTGPFTFLWSPNGATSSTTSMSFNNPDVACVTVTDAEGCVATACDTVWPGGCFADFWIYGNNPNGGISAEDTVQAYFTGSMEPNNSYVWTVSGAGMTMTYTGQNPWMWFPTAGTYTVCVTLDDGFGCTDTYCQDVQVGASNNCYGYVTASYDSLNASATLCATGTGGTAPYTYSWSPNQENSQCITVTSSGTYCVYITDATGCTYTACETVTLGGGSGNCDVYITSYIDSTNGCEVFVAIPTGVAPYSYDWSTGEATQSIMACNTFPGDTVCVWITDATGCAAMGCAVTGGGSGGCQASFYSYIDSTCMMPLDCFQFVDQSSSPANQAVSWVWDLGDGTTSTLQNPMHAYSNPGTYYVCLTVTMLDGCTSTYCDYITVSGGTGNCEGWITGFVGAGSFNQPLDAGTVWLITYDDQTNLLTAVDSAIVDSGGYFYFGPVPCGDYLLKAAAGPNSAYYADHIPTYHGNSPFWDFAQTVSIGQANVQVLADILLIAGNNPGGPGFIGGDVTQGANKMEDEGDPVVGATVLLFDMNGNNIAYQYTDGNGEFGFSNLAWGTYQVYVEMLNKETEPAIVTIGPDNPSVDEIHIQVFDTEITTSIEEQPVVLEDNGLYPNPSNGITTVDLSSEISTQLIMNITEMTGRTVMSQTYQLNPGSNRLQFNADQLSGGYYNITFTNAETTVRINEKLIVVGQ